MCTCWSVSLYGLDLTNGPPCIWLQAPPLATRSPRSVHTMILIVIVVAIGGAGPPLDDSRWLLAVALSSAWQVSSFPSHVMWLRTTGRGGNRGTGRKERIGEKIMGTDRKLDHGWDAHARARRVFGWHSGHRQACMMVARE